MQENLRHENNLLLIAALLREIVIAQSVITLWQNQDGVRVLAQALAKEINFAQKQIVLIPSKKNFLDLKKEELIYFRSEQRNIIFKCKSLTLLKDLLFIPIPSDIRLREQRGEDRTNFNNEFAAPSITLEDRLESFQLADISSNGASFVIPRGSLSKFFIDDFIILKGPGSAPDSLPVEARVMHISPFYEGKVFSNQHFRVGIRFKQSLDVRRFITPYQILAS